AERVTEVRNLAASLLLDTATVTWRQLQGWITCLPLGYDAVGMRRVFDTDALAACFPFTSPDLPLGTGDAGMGVLFGLNLASSGVRINPLDLNPGDGEDALYRRTQFMQTLTTVASPNGAGAITDAARLSGQEAAALDDAVLAAYRAKGITTDPRTWRRPAPLLGDVVAELAKFGEAGRSVAARLRPYVAGSFKGLFDGPTTTPAAGHLVVYAIKELDRKSTRLNSSH